jgi:hypothetical protein
MTKPTRILPRGPFWKFPPTGRKPTPQDLENALEGWWRDVGSQDSVLKNHRWMIDAWIEQLRKAHP